MREHPILLSSGGEDLFGIVTEPAATAPERARAGIVYLTRPRAHRNRMWVDAARMMAQKGFVGIRFDYHGEGDSTGQPRLLRPETPYAGDAVAAMRHLVEVEGVERVGVLGSCFDARTALAAVHEAPRFDALVFMSAPVLDERGENERLVEERDLAHYARRLREPGAWQALLSRERVGTALRILATRAARRLRIAGGPKAHPEGGGDGAEGAEGAAPPSRGPTVSEAFLRDFHALVDRRVPTLFLYGDRDSQYPGFRIAMDRALPELPREARDALEFTVLKGEAHGYLSVALQQEIVQCATTWLARTLSASGAR